MKYLILLALLLPNVLQAAVFGEPSALKRTLSFGDQHGCYIGKDAIQCWGSDLQKESSGPTGYPSVGVHQIVAGDENTCLMTYTSVKCWGFKPKEMIEIPQLKNPRQLIKYWYGICVLDDEGLKCFSSIKKDNRAPSTPVNEYLNRLNLEAKPLFTALKSAAVVGNSFCAIDASEVKCWQEGPDMHGGRLILAAQEFMETIHQPRAINAMGPDICIVDGSEYKCMAMDSMNTGQNRGDVRDRDTSSSLQCELSDVDIVCYGSMTDKLDFESGEFENIVVGPKIVCAWGKSFKCWQSKGNTLFSPIDLDNVFKFNDSYFHEYISQAIDAEQIKFGYTGYLSFKYPESVKSEESFLDIKDVRNQEALQCIYEHYSDVYSKSDCSSYLASLILARFTNDRSVQQVIVGDKWCILGKTYYAPNSNVSSIGMTLSCYSLIEDDSFLSLAFTYYSDVYLQDFLRPLKDLIATKSGRVCVRSANKEKFLENQYSDFYEIRCSDDNFKSIVFSVNQDFTIQNILDHNNDTCIHSGTSEIFCNHLAPWDERQSHTPQKFEKLPSQGLVLVLNFDTASGKHAESTAVFVDDEGLHAYGDAFLLSSEHHLNDIRLEQTVLFDLVDYLKSIAEVSPAAKNQFLTYINDYISKSLPLSGLQTGKDIFWGRYTILKTLEPMVVFDTSPLFEESVASEYSYYVAKVEKNYPEFLSPLPPSEVSEARMLALLQVLKADLLVVEQINGAQSVDSIKQKLALSLARPTDLAIRAELATEMRKQQGMMTGLHPKFQFLNVIYQSIEVQLNAL